MDDSSSNNRNHNNTPTNEEKVKSMIQACRDGNLHVINALLSEQARYAAQQDDATGQSPLMAAAAAGNVQLCRHLLEAGAPWNALDRQGSCAGNFATQMEHWPVVNFLVDWAVQAELILGRVQHNQRLLHQQRQRQQRQQQEQPVISSSSGSNNTTTTTTTTTTTPIQGVVPVEHEPCTKPDYLQQPLSYTANGRALLDRDQDAVMMEWERPLMQAHAKILMEQEEEEQMETSAAPAAPAGQAEQSTNSNSISSSSSSSNNKTVLNVGFGMGIIDSILLQQHHPRHHYIIEAHPDVYQHMLQEGWDQKPNVTIFFGKWQDVIPQLVAQRELYQMDAIFFDTYGEHYLDMQEFHQVAVQPLLSKPHGIYSFFNGLAPDNLFFHGVACQCVKLELAQLGLNAEFLPCLVEKVREDDWNNVRRPYWHGRDTYYLPRIVWDAHFLATGTIRPEPQLDDNTGNNGNTNKHVQDEDMEDAKRQRT